MPKVYQPGTNNKYVLWFYFNPDFAQEPERHKLTDFSSPSGFLRAAIQDVSQRVRAESGILPFFADVGVHGGDEVFFS